MNLGNFCLQGSSAVTQVLFLKFKEMNLTVTANGATYGISHDQLSALQTPLSERLSAFVTDFIANAILRFDPATETFDSFPSNRRGAAVRQMLGRAGEAWGAESGTDRLVVLRY